jgi:Mg-chelatase subunit ChlD
MKPNGFILKSLLSFLFLILFSLSLNSAESLYTKDIDHDGFPDDLEKNTGYNPRVNEALVKSSKGGKCGVIKTDLVKIGRPDNILIILDTSGSMNSRMSGESRMNIAKKILKKYINALPGSMRVGLVIYGKSRCGDRSIELIAPIGKMSRDKMLKKITALRPRGLTPIAMTLKKSVEYFSGFEKDNNNLILISDGMESCRGNPVQAIIDLKETKADPEVTVIGLGVDRRTRKQLAAIASSSGGKYSDVKSEGDFVKAFASFFGKLNKFYKDIVCIVRQYNTYLTYETQQYNKSKSYLIRAKMKATGDLRSRLDEVEREIDQNHREREKARNMIIQMVKNKVKDIEVAIKAFADIKR